MYHFAAAIKQFRKKSLHEKVQAINYKMLNNRIELDF